MVDTERVTIRLPVDKLEQLEKLVKQGMYKNKSDAIRVAIEKFMETEAPEPNVEKLTIKLSKGNAVKLGELVETGDSVSVEEAVRDAIKDYTKKRFETDRQRDRILVAEGWKTMRVTWLALRDEPEEIAADLKSALEQPAPTHTHSAR